MRYRQQRDREVVCIGSMQHRPWGYAGTLFSGARAWYSGLAGG